MTRFADRGRHNKTLADMTNSRDIRLTESVDQTLCNNLPVMAVAPLIPDPVSTIAEETGIEADEKMVAATLAVLETGSITPLIKEELKCHILHRRFKEGKESIQVDFTVPKKKKLTKEEQERAIVRREQNRVAAQRFREKQKDTAGRLLKKTERLESANTALRAELMRLKEEKDRLKETLNDHLLVCPVAFLTRP